MAEAILIPALTAERLRELLNYDPDTGVFTRKTSAGGECAGKIAGTRRRYRKTRIEIGIGIDYADYRAHRLAWLYVYGKWPVGHIDHKDGNPLNNAISNLREATGSLNGQNLRKARRDNKSGLLGVSPNRLRWSASIKADGRKHHLGTFDTAEEAHAAYVAAKRKLHEGCTI
jgi:hypothetical protein